MLVENAGRIVSKEELLQQVWPGTFVEEGNLTWHVSALRKALERDGECCIETRPKRGYRFAAPVRKRPVAAEAQCVPPAAPAVLVVEDDPVTREIVRGLLVDARYEVVAAEDGAAALLWLGGRRFDLVVADIEMPTLDGLTLLRVIGEKGLATPTIFLTGLTGSALEAQGLALGAADYIRKPVDAEVLLLRVRKVLGGAARD